MSLAPKRVLIVADEQSTLVALSEYLTFRGFRVDAAKGMDSAGALVRHISYDAVVFNLDPGSTEAAAALAREVRLRHAGTRLVALVAENVADVEANAVAIDADFILGRHLPTQQLARLLLKSVAA